MKLIDITNKRFGRWLVIRYIEERRWLCVCDCGTTKEVDGGNLRCEKSLSCGCLNEELKKGRCGTEHSMYGKTPWNKGKKCPKTTGDKNGNWKGGKHLDSRGYVRVSGHHRSHEHRLVAEAALGRRLKRHEVVHHINGNKADNRNCNLLVCTQSYHKALHGRMEHLYMEEHFN